MHYRPLYYWSIKYRSSKATKNHVCWRPYLVNSDIDIDISHLFLSINLLERVLEAFSCNCCIIFIGALQLLHHISSHYYKKNHMRVNDQRDRVFTKSIYNVRSFVSIWCQFKFLSILKSLDEARKVGGHVYVFQEYRFCLILRFFNWILELFRQCDIFCFSFFVLNTSLHSPPFLEVISISVYIIYIVRCIEGHYLVSFQSDSIISGLYHKNHLSI